MDSRLQRMFFVMTLIVLRKLALDLVLQCNDMLGEVERPVPV